jgi:FtsP/CotA-like multicopper oxidase with cupredoxin domain
MAAAGAAGAWLPPDLARHAADRQAGRFPLGQAPSSAADGLTLTARPATVGIGPGSVEAWTLNGSVPSPTIRVRQGQTARIDLVNRLPEPTILHWHGLAVPYEADGHPRWAIDPGETYSYEFRVLNRPGTDWYHPHTHMRTAAQTYKGIGGFFLIEGDETEELGVPGGERDIPLLLQDKRLGGALSLEYQLGIGPDMMLGYLGDTIFGNGVVNPTVDVQRTRYRLRVLNGSSARIFDLGLSTGDRLTLIGGDGGLLGAPVPVERVMLAPAERAEIVVDFSSRRAGERIMLRSLPFQVPGMMMGMGGGRGMMGGGGGIPQGVEIDLLEFVVQDSPAEPSPPLAARFPDVPGRGEITADTPRRTFAFQSMMMNHTINGRSFEMERIDERVRMNQTEVWTFVNDSELPHPVHVHAGQFRLLSRTGGRGQVMPWEAGLKDTVLTLPGERVDLVVRFVYPGVFLLHCHNLEHEDMGLMLNFEVVE